MQTRNHASPSTLLISNFLVAYAAQCPIGGHVQSASSHPPSRNSSFAIQGPSFGIQASTCFIKPQWRVHASFVTSTSTESKHRILVTSILHASSSHPPQRNPSIEFRSHQYSTPVRRIHLQEIQALHFGHFNPPSTSNWLCLMRLQSLRAITFVLYTFFEQHSQQISHRERILNFWPQFNELQSALNTAQPVSSLGLWK